MARGVRGLGTGLGLLLLATSGAVRADPAITPKPLYQPAPEWPVPAAEFDVLVPVVLSLDANGNVTQVQIEASVGPEFDAEAIATASTWKFSPAQTADGAVPSKIRAVVRFEGAASARRASSGTPPATPHEGTPVEASDEAGPSDSSSPERFVRPNDEPIRIHVQGERPPASASEVIRRRRVLSAAPHRTASDLLMTVPGTFVTQHSGEGKAHQIFFRGFDAVHGQDLEIRVAGAPVNEVSHLHGQGYADLHFVMPEVVQTLTALPGPYRSEQGDFAVAGSLWFELGYPEPGFTARGRLGSFDTRRLFLAYHPEGEPAATFAAFESYTTEGFGVGRAAQRTSAIAQYVHPLSANASLRLMASTYAARFGSAGVVRLDDLYSEKLDRFGSYDTDQGGHSTRTQLVSELSVEHDDWQLQLTPFFVARSLELQMNYTGFLLNPETGDRTEQVNTVNTIGLRSSLKRRLSLLSPNDTVQAGVSARHDFIEQAQTRQNVVDGSVTETLVDAELGATTVGGFLETVIHPIRRLALRGGARLDALSFAVKDALSGGSTRSAQGAHLGGKFSADYALAAGLHALASFGQGFRSPQARSLADGERAPFTEVNSLEAGLRFRDRQLSTSAAAFATHLSDDLVFDETTARNEAVPPTLRTGVVADFVGQPSTWFTSALSLTYTHAEFRDSKGRYNKGDLVPFVPQVVARSDLAIEPEIDRWWDRPLVLRAGTGLTYLYRRPLPYSEFGNNVFLVDARVGLRLQELELSLELLNALDLDWFDGQFVYASNFERGTAPSLVPARHVTMGAPRTIWVSLSLYI